MLLQSFLCPWDVGVFSLCFSQSSSWFLHWLDHLILSQGLRTAGLLLPLPKCPSSHLRLLPPSCQSSQMGPCLIIPARLSSWTAGPALTDISLPPPTVSKVSGTQKVNVFRILGKIYIKWMKYHCFDLISFYWVYQSKLHILLKVLKNLEHRLFLEPAKLTNI